MTRRTAGQILGTQRPHGGTVIRAFAPLLLAFVLVTLAGCSGASEGASVGPATTVVVLTVSSGSTTTTTEAAGITTELVTTSTTDPATTTTAAPTTTTVAVEVTNESGDSACLIKDVFTRDGTDYLVVDYVSTKPNLDTDAENDQIITNQNHKLRTFVIPAGAHMTAYSILEALLGKSALLERLDANNWDSSITVDELKQAVAKGIVNSAAGYGFWWLEVSKGRVVTLTNDFG